MLMGIFANPYHLSISSWEGPQHGDPLSLLEFCKSIPPILGELYWVGYWIHQRSVHVSWFLNTGKWWVSNYQGYHINWSQIKHRQVWNCHDWFQHRFLPSSEASFEYPKTICFSWDRPFHRQRSMEHSKEKLTNYKREFIVSNCFERTMF